MKDATLGAYNVEDLRERARRRLPKGLFEFVDRGAEDEVALRNNRAAFERVKLITRTLIDVSGRSQAVTLFGHTQKMPLVIAPTGAAGLMWHNGEIEVARAAAAAGIPFTLSMGSLTPLERVAEEAGGRLWFQIYMWADRSLSHKLIERVKHAGYHALVVTVDGLIAANREYNRRNGFTIPFTFNRRSIGDVLAHPRWLSKVILRYMLTTGLPRYENYPSEIKKRVTAAPMGSGLMKNDSIRWEDLADVRRAWPHALIVKGILHPEDALLAAQCGADGVIVSNHGGRHLDSTTAPIDVLPAVVDAVGKRMSVMVDSGFRRGGDVVKALALGAQAVLTGRPALYGCAVAGEAGASRALAIFREEIDRVMAMVGAGGIDALGRDRVVMSEMMEKLTARFAGRAAKDEPPRLEQVIHGGFVHG